MIADLGLTSSRSQSLWEALVASEIRALVARASRPRYRKAAKPSRTGCGSFGSNPRFPNASHLESVACQGTSLARMVRECPQPRPKSSVSALREGFQQGKLLKKMAQKDFLDILTFTHRLILEVYPPNLTHGRGGRNNRANPSEPDRLKVIRMMAIGHSRQGANPTQLSGPFSDAYAPKRACFWEIVCVRTLSNCRLRPFSAVSRRGNSQLVSCGLSTVNCETRI